MSRLAGTGPYYRLQIVDFTGDGITTWSYASDGAPTFDGAIVSLGSMDGGYQGAATQTRYRRHRLTPTGLVAVDP